MRIELTKKTEAALKKITDHGKEIGTPAEIIEFAVDRFLRRRKSIKRWQDEHAKRAKRKGKTKTKAKAAPRKPAKPKRSSKPRPKKPVEAPSNGVAHAPGEE